MLLQQNFEQMIRNTACAQSITIHDASIHYVARTLFDHLTQRSIGQQFLSAALLQTRTINEAKLQIIGDECLITAGMFPEKSSHLFSVQGYIALGQAAYDKLGRIQPSSSPDFTQISIDLPDKVHVLHHCRSHTTHSTACPPPPSHASPATIQPQKPYTRH